MLDSPDIQLLTQLGYVAAARGDTARSQRIFDALALLRPQHAFAPIGLACAWMNAGQAAQAVQHLSRVHLPAGDEADMLDAFRGLALQLAGHAHHSTAVLQHVVERTTHQPGSPARRMAQAMLGQLPAAAATTHRSGVASPPLDQSPGPL